LPYASNQAEPSECLSGTRSTIITEIVQWFAQPLNDTSERLFWLYGVAGCGKSTVAQTIARQLSAQHRCVSFFFNASRQGEVGLDRLFATISQDLADLSADWKTSLVRTLKANVKARKSSSVTSQFENLILEPAKYVDGVGPVLIIIDALDESGSWKERASLLQALTRITELPTHFRFLVTSRPESDIVNALDSDNDGHTWVRSKRLDETDKESTNQDIWSFVHYQLSQISALRESWTDDWVNELTTRSDQLFQWAFTACEYISGDGSIGCNPLERLKELLNSTNYGGLDSLYKNILDRVATFQPGDKMSRRFAVIMGRILSVRQPLSLEALSALWSDGEDRDQVKSILAPLGSLLRGVSGKHEPIQPLHASFIDFLTDQKRSGQYWIDLKCQDELIARSSLREMERLLKFNICGLDTSYVFNCDISDLDSRVQQSIPPHLSYACCFWIDHLHNVTFTDEWRSRLNRFMQHYLFFWLEAMSLLSRVERISTQQLMLKDWLESMVSDPNSPLNIVVLRITYIGLLIRTTAMS
jgi:hypothetical protein